MTSSEDRAQHLTQKLTGYILYQECSDKVKQKYGQCCNTGRIYNEAYKEWKSDPSNPLVEPPLGDQARLDAHFAKCDSICALEPQNALDIYKISFACWAGMQVMRSQLLAGRSDKEKIIVTASRLATNTYRIQRENAELMESLDSTCTSMKLPLHLQPGNFPATSTEDITSAEDIGPDNIGTKIMHLDETTGKIRECMICDYGTSELRGDWIEITYDDNDDDDDSPREWRIAPWEMDEILANRIL